MGTCGAVNLIFLFYVFCCCLLQCHNLLIGISFFLYMAGDVCYGDSRFLGVLLDRLPVVDKGVSLVLRPNLPEIDSLSFLHRDGLYTPNRYFSGQKDSRLSEHASQASDIIPLLELYDILPFWSLEFDVREDGFGGPRVLYEGPSARSHEEVLSSVGPSVFSGKNRWFGISFYDRASDGHSDISFIRDAASTVCRGGYRVYSLSVSDSPYAGNIDHLGDNGGERGGFSAGGGMLVFRGDSPDLESVVYDTLGDFK
jgi:hypothetical protein